MDGPPMKDERVAGLIGYTNEDEVDRIGVQNDEAVEEELRQVTEMGVGTKAVMMKKKNYFSTQYQRKTLFINGRKRKL